MHVYQMRSSIPSLVSASQERLQICMGALKEVSKVWLVAKTVHTLFLSILGNKTLEERLQKAAGRRHKRTRADAQPNQSPPRSRYEDVPLGFRATPGPQVSFERARPQTPAATQQPNPPPAPSPSLRQNDTFMGTTASRTQTREPTPFAAQMLSTPPDLYLVTRNSPTISQSFWENFQPDQLFPESSYMTFPTTGNLDPALQAPVAGAEMAAPMVPVGSGANALGTTGLAGGLTVVDDATWAAQPSPDDSWSNSSRGGPSVPTTLNVEDWYQFFGVNGGEMNQAADIGM